MYAVSCHAVQLQHSLVFTDVFLIVVFQYFYLCMYFVVVLRIFRRPKFSAHLYCGHTAGWMKLVLGMEVGLSPGDFVLDGDAAPTP